MNNQRPTFGANSAPTTAPANTTEKQFRKEVGAIWEQPMKTNEKFLSLRLKVPKDLVEKALAAANGDEVYINLVAFPNKAASEAPNRPAFRIYEERKKG